MTTSGDAITVQLVALAFDVIDADEMARFWAHALGWDIVQGTNGAVELVANDPTSFRIHVRSGAHAKLDQNRIHFDLTTASIDDQRNTAAALVAMGARHIDIGQSPDETHVVLADPEGNELCLIAPFNRFLASCPRLGAVNCDGSHALGCFWRDVLGWPLVWDEGEETAIQAPSGTGPKITWSGPPYLAKLGPERMHFHLAPASGATVNAAIDHLMACGASRIANGHACEGAIAFADVDANRFCLIEP